MFTRLPPAEVCHCCCTGGETQKEKNPNKQQKIPCDLQHLHMQGFLFLFSVAGLLVCKLMGEVVLVLSCWTNSPCVLFLISAEVKNSKQVKT